MCAYVLLLLAGLSGYLRSWPWVVVAAAGLTAGVTLFVATDVTDWVLRGDRSGIQVAATRDSHSRDKKRKNVTPSEPPRVLTARVRDSEPLSEVPE